MREVIKIEDREIQIDNGYMLYKGRKVIDVKELPDGGDEMRFCDDNEVPLPDSPVILCGPVMLE